MMEVRRSRFSSASHFQADRGNDRLERKENEVWRLAILMLVILAVGVAVLSQQALQTSQWHLEALPAGAGVLIVLFGAYVWSKKREIDELRGFVRGFRKVQNSPPSAEQLERLAEVIANSRQGYRDLIDSLDHLIFTTSLEGEIRAVNQRITQVFGFPYSELVGHCIDEFFDEPRLEHLKDSIAWFVEKRHCTGTVRACLKKTGTVLYFDCVLQAQQGRNVRACACCAGERLARGHVAGRAQVVGGRWRVTTVGS